MGLLTWAPQILSKFEGPLRTHRNTECTSLDVSRGQANRIRCKGMIIRRLSIRSHTISPICGQPFELALSILRHEGRKGLAEEVVGTRHPSEKGVSGVPFVRWALPRALTL